MGLALQGEFYYGRAEGQSSNELLHAQGGYGQVGYMVLPRHLEAAVRYSLVDPDTDQDDDSRTEYQGAVSYYFSGHPLKLQAEFTHRRDDARGGPTTGSSDPGAGHVLAGDHQAAITVR